jgi:arabinofuranosyltransferase
VPLSNPRYSVGLPGVVLGTLGAVLPLGGLAIDEHGLAYALGGHLQPIPGARVGHAKYAGLAWIIAQYSTAGSAPGVPAADIAAARKALGCGELARLIRATSAPLTLHQFLANITDSPGLTSLSIPSNPHQAVAQLCR